VRLLHLADRLTDRGGAYRHLLGVLEALAPGHEVVLAVGRDDGLVAAPCPTRVVPGLEARTSSPVDLEGLAADVRPDLVHAHNLVNPVALRWLAARPRAVLTVQDHRAFCPTRGKWTSAGRVCREPMAAETCAPCFEDPGYFREVYALTLERLEAVRRLRVVVPSRYMAGELAGAGVPAGRIHVVPPFVHGLLPDALPEGPASVLFAGRLAETKGVSDAVEAWRRSGVDLPLVIAGTGPLRDALEREGLPVLGWIGRERLSRLYRAARAVLLPSRWQEPFGIVGLEALAMGVPVVAWESGGVGEWHPGGDGLVPWGDRDGLAAALRAEVGRPRAVLSAPPGFDRDTLMARLAGVYAERT